MRPSRLRLPALLVVLLGGSGCIARSAQFNAVREGMVTTPGVSIWDPSSTFLLEAGRPFQAPYVTDRCLHGSRAGDYRAAREGGARPVVVKVPGRDEPLYGLLALCRVPSMATGPSSRSFDIRVPHDKVEATEGLLVSLVYENTNYADFPLWQLWLARTERVWE